VISDRGCRVVSSVFQRFPAPVGIVAPIGNQPFRGPRSAKVMLLPVLFPISQQLGIDPIHFGVVVTVNLCIGLITPPIGIVLAIASQIGNISIVQGTRAVMPFMAVALLVLALLTFIPALSTFLPDLLMGPRLS
jgi:TRAP-type transport system large permease protein